MRSASSAPRAVARARSSIARSEIRPSVYSPAMPSSPTPSTSSATSASTSASRDAAFSAWSRATAGASAAPRRRSEQQRAGRDHRARDRGDAAGEREQPLPAEEEERGKHEAELEEALAEVVAQREALDVLGLVFLGLGVVPDPLGVVRVLALRGLELRRGLLGSRRVGAERLQQLAADLRRVLADLLGLVVAPQVVRLRPPQHRVRVLAVRGDRDDREGDADDADHDAEI